MAKILLTEPGWFKTGLAQLEIVFAQHGTYMPSHQQDGTIIRDGSDGQSQRWETYLATLPKRTFQRKRSRLAFELRGDPAIDFQDFGYFTSVTRDQIRIGAKMVLDALVYAESTLKPSDGVDLSVIIAAAESLTRRTWESEVALNADLTKAHEIDRARIDAMDPWSTIDMTGFHRDARKILDQPSDWSQINDFSPHGNDLGADILNDWSSLKRLSVENVAARFELDFVAGSDETAMDRIQLMLALAFGHIKKSGVCPPELAGRALTILRAEKDRAAVRVVAEHQTGWQSACDRYEAILARMVGARQ